MKIAVGWSAGQKQLDRKRNKSRGILTGISITYMRLLTYDVGHQRGEWGLAKGKLLFSSVEHVNVGHGP